MRGGYSYPEAPRGPRTLSDQPIARIFADAGTVSIPFLDDELRPVLGKGGQPLHLTTPSPVGFTWAWVLVGADGEEEARESGYVLAPLVVGGRPYRCQSELGEFYALARGFQWLARNRPGWSGEVLSDNHLALGRVFRNVACHSLPPELVERSARHRRRLGGLIEVPINGHPTREHLARGYGHSDYPVSTWNVKTDLLCAEMRLPALEDWHATRRQEAPAPIQAGADIALARERALAERRLNGGRRRARVRPDPEPATA